VVHVQARSVMTWLTFSIPVLDHEYSKIINISQRRNIAHFLHGSSRSRKWSVDRGKECAHDQGRTCRTWVGLVLADQRMVYVPAATRRMYLAEAKYCRPG